MAADPETYVATFNGKEIAKSSATQMYDGKRYFPEPDVIKDFFEPSEKIIDLGAAGQGQHLHIVVDGKKYENGAWYINTPNPVASHIAGFVSYGSDVEVKKEETAVEEAQREDEGAADRTPNPH